MSVQDNTEQVLRAMHVILARSEVYEDNPQRVIIDKQQMLDLLDQLNLCIYDMMEQYELTKAGRNQAERDFNKYGDQIIQDANRKAEDIYAASVIYTDDALGSIQDIMHETQESVQVFVKQMQEKFEEKIRQVRHNQLELKSQLQSLVDTEKYLKIIDERNKEVQRQKEKLQAEMDGRVVPQRESSIYANRQTEIKINEAYFEKMGLALEEQLADEIGDLQKPVNQPEIKVNVDAEYFQWKEKQGVKDLNQDEHEAQEHKKSSFVKKIKLEKKK